MPAARRAGCLGDGRTDLGKDLGKGDERTVATVTSLDTFGAKGTLKVGDASYEIHRLDAAGDVARLPYSLKILLENLLRTEDGANITADDVRSLVEWDASAEPSVEIQFTPARVIMQDFTGVPAVVDLATMREAMTRARR